MANNPEQLTYTEYQELLVDLYHELFFPLLNESLDHSLMGKDFTDTSVVNTAVIDLLWEALGLETPNRSDCPKKAFRSIGMLPACVLRVAMRYRAMTLRDKPHNSRLFRTDAAGILRDCLEVLRDVVQRGGGRLPRHFYITLSP